MSKYVYRFGGGLSDGDASMKNLLGGKGANLAEMAKIGLPVPPGFTITTEVCTYYYQHNESYPDGFRQDVMEGIRHIEKIIGKRFGDADNPLLVSVRSGARVSMPGMMDTILNIGLNDETVRGLVRATGDERFAYDSYRRLVQMYGNVVLEVPRERFEEIISEKKKERGVTADTKLSADDWKEIIARYKELIKEATGRAFPEEPEKQLMGAIGAVFDSWNTRRAKDYRRVNNIPDEWGTAVN
ncbi:pyruvate, phosphate dikinase, partial [bacterium]